jgi:hypothetical protein
MKVQIGVVALFLLSFSVRVLANPKSPSPAPPHRMGPAIVIDSQGKQIGPFFRSFNFAGGNVPSTVLRNVNDTWIQIPVTPGGFNSAGVQLLYKARGCSGTAYLQEGSIDLDLIAGDTGNAAVANQILYYPTNLQECSGNFLSFLPIDHNGVAASCDDIQQECFAFFGPVATFDLSTLGFVPPFSLSVIGAPQEKWTCHDEEVRNRASSARYGVRGLRRSPFP